MKSYWVYAWTIQQLVHRAMLYTANYNASVSGPTVHRPKLLSTSYSASVRKMIAPTVQVTVNYNASVWYQQLQCTDPSYIVNYIQCLCMKNNGKMPQYGRWLDQQFKLLLTTIPRYESQPYQQLQYTCRPKLHCQLQCLGMKNKGKMPQYETRLYQQYTQTVHLESHSN